MSSEAAAMMPTRRHMRQTRSDRRKVIRRRSILFGVLIVFLLIIGSAVWVGVRALSAKSALEHAVGQVKSLQANMSSLQTANLQGTYDQLHENTKTAVDMTSDWVWATYEHIPWLGPNLVAFRQTAELVDDVVVDGLHPVVVAGNGIGLDSLKPVDGRINLDPIRKLTPAIITASAVIDRAHVRAEHIDTSGTVTMLSDKVRELSTMLGKASDLLKPIAKELPIVVPALGGDGPRHYLMIFQNNAETRAEGGNPASIVLLDVDNGKIDITKQASSRDFRNGRARPVIPLNDGVEHIYSKIIGTYVQNIPSSPDFPTTAALARAYWDETFGGKIDGVISFDPVALQSLLAVTGPVKLETGDTLTAQNAVPLLLNEVYFRYTNPKVQDAFFAAAAKSIFGAVTSGKGDVGKMFDALKAAGQQQRLLLWSANKKEQALVEQYGLGGILPADNKKSTVVGAYFNDVTGAKMDYYADAKVAVSSTQCTADAPTFTEKVTFSNNLPAAKVGTLPEYITGQYYKQGSIGTDVVVYGPVGSTITGWTADRPATVKAMGSIGGRPVSRILVKLWPGESVTLTYTIKGAKGAYGPLKVETTPMVRATPVTVSAPGCKGAGG